MLRIGVLLTVLGFGSAILHYTEIQFRLLSWSEDMQPVFGIAVGLVGAALIAVPMILQKRKAAPAAPPAAAPAPAPQNPPQV